MIRILITIVIIQTILCVVDKVGAYQSQIYLRRIDVHQDGAIFKYAISSAQPHLDLSRKQFNSIVKGSLELEHTSCNTLISLQEKDFAVKVKYKTMCSEDGCSELRDGILLYWKSGLVKDVETGRFIIPRLSNLKYEEFPHETRPVRLLFDVQDYDVALVLPIWHLYYSTRSVHGNIRYTANIEKEWTSGELFAYFRVHNEDDLEIEAEQIYGMSGNVPLFRVGRKARCEFQVPTQFEIAGIVRNYDKYSDPKIEPGMIFFQNIRLQSLTSNNLFLFTQKILVQLSIKFHVAIPQQNNVSNLRLSAKPRVKLTPEKSSFKQGMLSAYHDGRLIHFRNITRASNHVSFSSWMLPPHSLDTVHYKSGSNESYIYIYSTPTEDDWIITVQQKLKTHGGDLYSIMPTIEAEIINNVLILKKQTLGMDQYWRLQIRRPYSEHTLSLF